MVINPICNNFLLWIMNKTNYICKNILLIYFYMKFILWHYNIYPIFLHNVFLHIFILLTLNVYIRNLCQSSYGNKGLNQSYMKITSIYLTPKFLIFYLHLSAFNEFIFGIIFKNFLKIYIKILFFNLHFVTIYIY